MKNDYTPSWRSWLLVILTLMFITVGPFITAQLFGMYWALAHACLVWPLVVSTFVNPGRTIAWLEKGQHWIDKEIEKIDEQEKSEL